MTAK
ncbi:hypothetical protein HU200_040380 [Digitaria exilis]|jgi:hypothetical protein